MTSDNTGTCKPLDILYAMVGGPVLWDGSLPAPMGSTAFDKANWAILSTSRRTRLFKVMAIREGFMTLKAADQSGSPQHRGPQYRLNERDLSAPGWSLHSEYEHAREALEAKE